ncbi:AAEL009988-PA [Aedes aegypti]|uniref:AAEL009988-PA n=1 Tax=Aedes aegypti TaxID=7159 RepID=Q16U87_AEDAE|nr:AAEL009988-PA [Aedes aegypti]
MVTKPERQTVLCLYLMIVPKAQCSLKKTAPLNKEPTNSSNQLAIVPAAAASKPRANLLANSSSTSNEIDDIKDPGTVDQTVTIMDQMNNVVTTTTTVTAIASTVHQSTGGVGGGGTSATGIIISSNSISKVVPPAFSRLPPDGHEFPPNFSEPTPNGMTVVTQSQTVVASAMALAKGDKHSSYDDIPDLPKSHPPAVPRKVYRQDLVLKALDQNHPEQTTTFKKPISLVGSNWRKDEKSERSVRDKIAMFSHGSGGGSGGGGGGGSSDGGSENQGHPTLRKYSKDFTKSSENLLGSESGYARKAVDPIEAYATLRKKAHSVENLDDVDSVQNVAEFRTAENGSYKTKFGLETSKPVVLDNGGMFGNAKILSRTTSFSGYSNGNSLATINSSNNVEERRKSSITSLLEQRKKSMSKLRGLVIPEKVPETEVRKTATLPTPAKSNGSSFQPMIAPKPTVTELGGTYKSIFRNLNGASPKADLKTEIDEQGFRRPLGPVPPAKPPRTSLVYPPPKGMYQHSHTTEDESDDSDSVMSSRISSPPVSPVAPSSPEKYVLTRTLSSETNTSITSSNSTLTSSSGSQASCSSVGSTPAIDMSRRISKSSSNEMTMNRKNVLASAKSRSGRGDLKIEDAANGKAKRYEDGDSTDGYEEEERRKSKSKPRGSIGSGKSNGFDEKELTHYKVVDTVDSIVDKVIKVASYVEVVSDVEEDASVETEVVVPMQKPAIVAKEVETPARPDVKKFARSFSEQISKAAEEIQTPTKRELRSSVDTKKLNLAEIRKSFEAKSNNSTVVPAPVKTMAKEISAPVTKSTPTTAVNSSHDRFSSWDSLASSSSGVSSLQTNSLLGNAVVNCSGSSQTLQSTPSDYGSFSSLGSSHSLITPQDLQLIIEEADPPLATPEAFVIVLQRETPESSIGITLAGGSDYEAKEITIHKILNNSPAEKDGRLRRGDRILSINGLSMRGLTHRESLSVLKTPRPEVVMVITRSKSLVIDNSTLSKTKRPSLGSLSSLAEKNEIPDYERKIKIQHKASRSLDLDLDIVSNEAESVFDGTASEDGLLSADESKCSSITPASDGIASPVEGSRVIEILKDGAGLGFSIEGGFDSPTGNKPLMIKKIFMGGAAEKSGLLKAGEEIVAINDISIERMTRIQVWNMMKKLPNGNVRIMLK